MRKTEFGAGASLESSLMGNGGTSIENLMSLLFLLSLWQVQNCLRIGTTPALGPFL